MKKTCYTRLMALALALMLLLPALPGALAAGGEVQWVDSGQGEAIEITRSKNAASSWGWYWSSKDTLVLASPGPVASVAMQNGHGGTVKGEVNSSVQAGSVWTSQIWVGCSFDWPSLTSGQQFSDTMVVTLENGQTMSFPVVITIGNQPHVEVNGGGWIDDLAVGQSVALQASLVNRDNLPAPNLRYTWELEAGGEFASLTADPADSSKAILTGLAVGTLEFSLDAEWDGGRAIGLITTVDITGELAGMDVSQAVTDLQTTGSATLDVPLNQGLKPDTLAQLKNAASPGDRVTLKHNGREEVTLSFDPPPKLTTAGPAPSPPALWGRRPSRPWI